MSKKETSYLDDVFTLTKTACIDFPLAEMQRRWGLGEEETVTKAAWTGYDAGVRLATAAIENWYRLPLTAILLKSSVPAFLRWQRISKAVTGAVFAGLWPTVGLSTTGETRALRDMVDQLRTELHAHRQDREALIGVATRLAQAFETERPLTPPSVFNGFVVNDQLSHSSASPTTRLHGN